MFIDRLKALIPEQHLPEFNALLQTGHPILMEDFYPHTMRQRYGGVNPVHPGIEAILAEHDEAYRTLLQEFLPFIDQLVGIPIDSNQENLLQPFWNNGFFSGIDAVALYCLFALKRPRRYIEVGSGNSTKFAAMSSRLNATGTHILSIDPFPRAEIDQLCDAVIRKPLEECNLTLFDELEAGDFLFFDGSHRVLQNSDNTVFYLEVLPRIKPGVIIHLHDIMLPADYPDAWSRRMYSEQYVLAAMLLFSHERFNIILPNSYISWCTAMLDIFAGLWQYPGLEKLERHGGSFWFSKIR